MHQITIRNTNYPLPSRWDELSRKQLITAAWLSTTKKAGTDLAKLLFLVLTQSLPWWKRIRLRFFYLFQANITERGDLIFITRSFAEFPDFTTQKIKNIGGRFVLFSGPLDRLSNCTLWEYILAEKHFLDYLKTKDENTLDKFIAVIYRPRRKKTAPDYAYDCRLPLVDGEVNERAKKIKAIDHRTKIAILMWFDGCRNLLIKNFPLIFKKEEEKPKGNKPRKSNSGGWVSLIQSLAEDMTQIEEIGKTNLTVALTDISHRIQKANQKPKKK
ncbi:hypothetical protein DN752_17765 [Echinicola strongylocentroti]|uniref:Uncharacterized protein n=1 Tax=Echinicola strongylocentroti TaxID=1795355 RepID=A0A2Z4IM79_9BACT|nr:hypothetical protein [Echinicola strongylocentroti]AWW31829.1 hypothetical protein DN752_17765 [Echinicola strongylocentroti]